MARSKRRKPMVTTNGGDDASLLLAAGCLAHCMLTPLLASVWPLVGLPLARSAGVHQLFAGITLVLSPLMLVPGYRSHRRREIVIAGGCGALLLLLGVTQAGMDCCSAILNWIEGAAALSDVAWRDWVGFLVTPLGCVLIGWAHWRNRSLLEGAATHCGRTAS